MEFTPKNRATVQNMPKLPYAVEEALNRLRVNVSFLGSKVKKIMVISSAPDEGKSFIAMQLWRQMAEAGSKSILVDMDLRKSVMVDKYQIVREDSGKILGTSDYLASDDTLDKYVLRTNIGAGDLLPNKENIINPSMLLEGQKLAGTFEELDENYRYTFIDAPPLNLVSDGEKIGSLCDGALLVVRAGETPKAMVRNSIRQQGVRLSALHSAVPKALQMDIITNMATTMAGVIMGKAMATMENMDITAMAQSRSR